jgi:hypothetical protein
MILNEALDLERLGRLEETRQLILSNIDLPFVHVLENGFDLRVENVLENHDGVTTVVFKEEALEVGGAGSENHFVAFD